MQNPYSLSSGFAGDTYEKCYTAFMSMQCASMFPMCTVPQVAHIQRSLISVSGLCTSCLRLLRYQLLASARFHYAAHCVITSWPSVLDS
ncbi:hypothetical protein FOZ61_004920, partial [Perkinsus olseni]